MAVCLVGFYSRVLSRRCLLVLLLCAHLSLPVVVISATTLRRQSPTNWLAGLRVKATIAQSCTMIYGYDFRANRFANCPCRMRSDMEFAD